MVDALAASERVKPTGSGLILEAWSQGFMVGALIIMCGITLANMRRGVLLHKLILIELLLAVPNGFFIFFNPPAWGWVLSATVVPLIISWTLHNIVAWLKSKPFLGRRGNQIYIGSILLAQSYWILEIYANFAFFNGRGSRLFITTRPYEALFRDPWWIFTIINLFWNIKYRYELSFIKIVQVSPRFGILLLCMTLSVISIIIDILSVIPVITIGVINPFWKFAFVFKCFTDSIILDDFKAALDKLSRHRMSQILPSNPLAETVSGRDSGFSERGCHWPREHGGSFDTHLATEMDHLTHRKSGGERSNGGSISSPSRAAVHHADHGAGGGE